MTPHDPERCATCSGKRHHPDERLRPVRLLADYLKDLAEAMRQARRKAP